MIKNFTNSRYVIVRGANYQPLWPLLHLGIVISHGEYYIHKNDYCQIQETLLMHIIVSGL